MYNYMYIHVWEVQTYMYNMYSTPLTVLAKVTSSDFLYHNWIGWLTPLPHEYHNICQILHFPQTSSTSFLEANFSTSSSYTVTADSP